MKNNVILLSAILFSGLASAQIGINSKDPQTTLDIHAKSSTGTLNTVEGLLIPRVDRERAQSMTNIPESTLIYVNDITTGTQSGIAALIDYQGYYYYDGRMWTKLNANISGIDQDNNIYNTNGTLDSDRLVEQGDKTLAFTGTAENAFSIDGNTFSIDAKNNRIGFGTTKPSSKFEIISDNVGGTGENNFYFRGFGTSIEPGILLTSAQGTHKEQANLNKNDLIGSLVFIPRVAGGYSTSAGTRIVSEYKGDGTTPLTNLMLSTSGVKRVVIDETGRVGIGTSTPNSRLDLGSTFGSSLTDNAGKKLAVYNNVGGTDFYGLGISSGVLQFHAASTPDETAGMVLTGNGNVGIGAVPAANVILDLSASNKAFLPPRLTTTQRNAINPKQAGMMVYNVTTNCLEFWNSNSWVSTCAAVAPPAGAITGINCVGAPMTGTLIANAPASGVNVTIPYTGGNGGSHQGQIVPSTGVTGLTATLSPGGFLNGGGNLQYSIAGTPSGPGKAYFAINIGGQGCSLELPIGLPTAVIGAPLVCDNPTNTGALTAGKAASGVSSSIAYTSGNGGTYTPVPVNSTGVMGLTATLTGSNINNGSGFLNYTITGTPNSAGTAYFAINIGGQSCTFKREVTAPAGTITNLDCNGRTINGTLKNNTTVSNVTFSVPYTGGNGGAYTTQSIPSTGVPGLTAKLTANNFNVGAGFLTYTIEGKPLGEGTASFNINIGGRNCTVNVTVNELIAADVICPAGSNDVYPYPNVNTKYIKCLTISTGTYTYIFSCPAGSTFNPNTKKCVLQ
jgi:hypothetical protein